LALFCVVLVIFSSSYGTAAPQRRGRIGRMGQGQQQGLRQSTARQAQEQKRRQAFESAAGAVNTNLVEMLNLVNEQRRPSEKKLASAQQTVQNSRKYIKQFNNSIACQFLMLDAWTNYFADCAEKALPPATQAYRKNPSNNDARSTEVALAVLAGRKSLALRPRRKQTRTNEVTTGRGRGWMGQGNDYVPGTASGFSGPVSSGNILKLDTDAIKADWLGRKVGPFSLNCLNGTTFSYNPAEANLCVIFWKLAAADTGDHTGPDDGEPNELSGVQRPAPIRDRYDDPFETGRMTRAASSDQMDDIMVSYEQDFLTGRRPTPGDTLSQQMSALGNIFNSEFQNPEVKFLGINTDSPDAAPAVVAKLLQSPMPWAQAMLNAPDAASAFSGLDLAQVTSDQPVLVVADKTGTVKYAGPAAGFLAPMVLDELTGRGSISAAITDEPLQSQEIMERKMTEGVGEDFEQMSQSMSDMEKMDDHVRLQTQKNTEITPEDYQAQKLLSYAQGLFIPAGRKKVITSKTGVELCRRIIRDYPNTTYADEARKLLRTVPPHERKRYNITPEEMGL